MIGWVIICGLLVVAIAVSIYAGKLERHGQDRGWW